MHSFRSRNAFGYFGDFWAATRIVPINQRMSSYRSFPRPPQNGIRSLLQRILPLCLAGACLWPDGAEGAAPLVQLTPTLYQTEHCLFVIDSSVTWSSPATAYNDIYGASGGTFPRLANYFTEITTRFPANYFSICYIANTGASNVPNYIDRIYKATGISSGLGSAGLGTSGNPNTPQSFASVDMCRYNLPGGNVITPVLGVFDHEIGHAWGAQIFYTLNQPSLSNGHWLPNSTVDCQLGSGTSTDGYITVNKIYGDPASGFRWQRVDNGRDNDYSVFSEQTLYLLGASPKFPTSYVLNNPVFNADLTVSSSSVDSFDHAAAVATYGVRNPDYKTAPKQFKLGFVYIARDLNEVNTVCQAVEQSIDQFCSGEAISTTTYRMQTPFLVDTRYRASVNGLLSDLDGNATPAITVNDTYVLSTDGTATIGFSASDPDGPAPAVSVVPASTQSAVVGNTVQLSSLPDGVHFFTLEAVDSGNKKAFGHFVVEVQHAAGSVSISSHPSTQTAVAGTAASFTVAANGDPATLAYQWYRQAARTSTWNLLGNGGAYGGAATSTLAISSTPAMDGDRFLCVVTDATGTATSREAALVVNETAPVLTAQTGDKNVTAGNSTFFRVTVGDPAVNYGYFQYQWQRQAAGSGSWVDLVSSGTYSGVNSSQLTLFGTTLGMNTDQFRCIVTDTAGTTTSNVATLGVGVAPAITVQPQPVSGLVGQTVSFSVTATGTAPLTYQWYKYGTPVGNASTLTLANIQPADAATYGVTITNAFGAAFSNNVGLTVGTAAPGFTTHPTSQTATVGASVTLIAAATGGPPPTYQWKKNGVNIAGATNATYTIAGVQAGDAGSYTVVATNSVGSATSNAAVLTIVPFHPSDGMADFNNDGHTDMLWQNSVTGQRSVWLMNGTTATGGVDLGTVPVEWVIAGTADFTGDGKTDLLWQNTVTGQRSVWAMNGTTAMYGVDLGTVSLDWWIAGIGDFNGDGKPDILWTNTVTNERAIWLMNGTAELSNVSLGVIPFEWTIAGAADFNLDGKTDILWSNVLTGERSIWLMNGTNATAGISLGIFTPRLQISGTGDYNGDGYIDILLSDQVSGARSVWLMNGPSIASTVSLGTVSPDWILNRPVPRRVPVDFNADNKSDIVWQNTVTGERSAWLMNGTTALSGISLGTRSIDWEIVATGDFNFDGRADLVWQNNVTGDCNIWLMNGGTKLSEVALPTIPLEWKFRATGDFNLDGAVDLVLQNTTTGECAVWYMNGTTPTGGASLGIQPLTMQLVGCGDFNADSKADIVWTNTSTGERSIWLMNGTTMASSVSLGVVPLQWAIAGTGDFDQDGNADLVWQNTATGERSIWLMSGTTPRTGVSLGTAPTSWSIRN